MSAIKKLNITSILLQTLLQYLKSQKKNQFLKI